MIPWFWVFSFRQGRRCDVESLPLYPRDPPIWILCYAPVGTKVSSLWSTSSPGKHKTRTRQKKRKEKKVGSRFNTMYFVHLYVLYNVRRGWISRFLIMFSFYWFRILTMRSDPAKIEKKKERNWDLELGFVGSEWTVSTGKQGNCKNRQVWCLKKRKK